MSPKSFNFFPSTRYDFKVCCEYIDWTPESLSTPGKKVKPVASKCLSSHA